MGPGLVDFGRAHRARWARPPAGPVERWAGTPERRRGAAEDPGGAALGDRRVRSGCPLVGGVETQRVGETEFLTLVRPARGSQKHPVSCLRV